MTLQLEWFGIAEAGVADARGVPVLVGVGQDVITAPILPHQTNRVFVVYLTDEEGSSFREGASASLDFRIESPRGKVLIANHQNVPLAEKKWADIEAAGIFLAINVQLIVEEPGTYTAWCDVDSPNGEKLTGQRKFYVRQVTKESDPASP